MKKQTETDNNRLIREEYPKALYRWIDYSANEFDKGIFYISTGALGLSITFIEKIVNKNAIICPWLLFLSWCCEILTIILFVFSHYISNQTVQKRLTEELEYQAEAEINRHSDRYNTWVKRINVMCIIFLLSGLILLITFVFKNLLK